LFQESTISTPVKDDPALKECEVKDEQELSKSSGNTLRESEIKNQKPSILNETKKIENLTDSKKENNTLKTQTPSNELSCTIETVKSNNETSKEIENTVEDASKENKNENVEPPNDTTIDELVPTIVENKHNIILELNEKNETNIIEQVSNAIPSKVVEDVKTHLNISEEIKLLDATVKNSIQLDNSTAEKYLQVNGDILPVDHESTNQNVDEIIENHIVSNSEDIVSKDIEIHNSLNTLLSEDLKDNIITEKENIEIEIMIDSESNENLKEKINGNILNQDSISNSSDSETIINSECLQHEINENGVENNVGKNVVAQPISVITIQTFDTVDSDCSEAYLTPNEVNDTPKKKLEKINLNANDHTSIVNDDVMSQLNPSIDSNNEVEIPSKNTSEAITEQRIKKEVIENSEEYDTSVEENINISKENVNQVEEKVNNIEENIYKVEENDCKVDEKVNNIEENINKIEENIEKIEENTVNTNETIHNIDANVVKVIEHVNIVRENEIEIESDKTIENCYETENGCNEDVNNKAGIIYDNCGKVVFSTLKLVLITMLSKDIKYPAT